jgi:hypothetical protein
LASVRLLFFKTLADTNLSRKTALTANQLTGRRLLGVFFFDFYWWFHLVKINETPMF